MTKKELSIWRDKLLSQEVIEYDELVNYVTSVPYKSGITKYYIGSVIDNYFNKCDKTIKWLSDGFTKLDILYSLVHKIELVRHYCLNCGKEVHVLRTSRKIPKYCNFSCRASHRMRISHSDPNSNLYKNLRSKERSEILRNAWNNNPERRKQASETMKEMRLNQTPESKERWLDSIYNSWTDERRANQSRIMSERLTTGVLSNPSKIELEILDYLKSIYSGNVVHNSWEVLKTSKGVPLELDIYLPELNIGIEVNGDYYHSSERKSFEYHLYKTKYCERNGVRLIHIWESEWKSMKLHEYLKRVIHGELMTSISGTELPEELIMDRRLGIEYQKLYDLGYEKIKSTPPELIQFGEYKSYDCGKVIFKKLK